MLSLVEPSRPSLVSDLLSLSALPNAIAPLSRILLPVYRIRMKGCGVDKYEPVCVLSYYFTAKIKLRQCLVCLQCLA